MAWRLEISTRVASMAWGVDDQYSTVDVHAGDALGLRH